jgi:hypothetical protein
MTRLVLLMHQVSTLLKKCIIHVYLISFSYLMGGDLIADDSVMGRGRCQLTTTRTDPNPLGLVTLNPQHQPPGPSPIGLVILNW